MDVDNPILEDAMETDPPPTPAPVPHRKSSSMDPDGDEQMGAGEELYDEEGDVEFAEGDEGNGEAEKHVDADGDITPAETEGGDQGYFEEEQEESGDVEVVEGKGFDEAGDGEPAVEEEKEGLAPSAQVTNTETDTALTTAPNAEGTVAEPPNNTAAAIDELQESQGNVAVGSADQTDGGEALPAAPVEEDGDQAGQSLGAEQNEAEAGISGVAQLGADERQPEYTEQLHAQEEGEEEEEEVDGVYQLLTYETLPPIMLHLPNAQRALFNPIVSEDGTSPPVWFGEKVQEFSEGTLTLLWSAIRGKLEGEGLGNEVDEMVIAEKLTDLKMGDSDVNLEDVTFLELVQMYHDCELPEPMELHVEFQTHRFITRFNAIQKELESREVVYIEEGGQEEGQEGEAADDEKHEGEEGDDEPVAGDADEAQADVAETETGQVTLPLPEGTHSEHAVAEATQPVDVPEYDQAESLEEHAGAKNDIKSEQPAAGIAATGTSNETGETTSQPANQLQPAGLESEAPLPATPAVRRGLSQVIAEDDALIGTPEIRAADARIITEQAAGQPESFEIGQTSAVEAGDPVLQTVSAVGPGAPDPTRDEADEAEQANMEPDASADSAATNADSGEQDDREAEAGDVVADEHRPEQTLEDQVEAGVEEFAEEGVDDAGEQPEVTAELGEGGYEEAEEEEGYEEAEEEEGYEEEEDGEDDDPYGVDKYVEGVDAEAGDEAGADEAEANGEEELEEYGEEEEADQEQLAADASVDPSDPHGLDHDHDTANGELHDEVIDETSPAKRSRSVDGEEEDSEVVAGKRAKLAEADSAAEDGSGTQ